MSRPERVLEYLNRADELLNEVETIGLWVKADDTSDNRRRRKALREADWAASSAFREAEGELRAEIDALVKQLEPLPDFVTDTMLDLPWELERKIRAAREEIERLRASLK